MKQSNKRPAILSAVIFGVLILSLFVRFTQSPTYLNALELKGYAPTGAVASLPGASSGSIDSFAALVSFLDSNVSWGPFMCLLLVGTGLYLTLGTGFFQFTHFTHMLKSTVGKAFSSPKTGAKGELTPFQALCTAMAGTVGTGNIAGVAGAIVLGGPGAVFWMWVAALFGMCTKYGEIVLAVRFREKNDKGEWVGGPMYTIKNGLGKGWSWLGVLFSVCGAFAAFGIGSMTQINTIAGSFLTALDSFTAAPVTGSPAEAPIRLVIGLVMAGLTALILWGGVKRIGAVTEKLVPFMSLFYVIGSLLVLIVNFSRLGTVFTSIFQAAFAREAVVGGVSGYVLMNAVQRGVSRGVFSNEAGLGSAPIAHASTSETDPVKQGLYGIFEVFADTIVICTMTALVILSSNAVPWGDSALAGAAATAMAFSTVFGAKLSGVFIAAAIFFFAFSTVLSWSLYGQRCFGYLTRGRFIPGYQLLFIVTVVLGASLKLSLVWNMANMLNGFMAVPNLIALLSLSPVVFRLTKEYKNRRKFV